MAKKIRQKWKTLFFREWTKEPKKSSSTQKQKISTTTCALKDKHKGKLTKEQEKSSYTHNQKISPTTCRLEDKHKGKLTKEQKKSISTQNKKISPTIYKLEDKQEAIKIKVLKIRLPGGKVLVRRF